MRVQRNAGENVKKVNFSIHQIDRAAVMASTEKSSQTITGRFSAFSNVSNKNWLRYMDVISF